MKKTIFMLFFIGWVAATHSFGADYGGDRYTNDLSLEELQICFDRKVAELKAAGGSAINKANERIGNLESTTSGLMGGLREDLDFLSDEVSLAEYELDYIKDNYVSKSGLDDTVNGAIRDSSSIVKPSTFNTKISEIYTTINGHTEQLNAQGARIAALEHGVGAGGGSFTNNCEKNWGALAGFLEGYADASSDAGGTALSFSTFPTLDTVFETLPIGYYGDSLSEVGGAVQMWTIGDDNEYIPTFSPSEDWGGDGISITAPEGEGGRKVIDVCVGGSDDNDDEKVTGNLSGVLDGTLTGDDAPNRIAAVTANGHLRAIGIGTITVGADGETIERSSEEEGDAPLLRVKTQGIIDGETLVLANGTRKAKVDLNAICDGETIGVNQSNKLYAKGGDTSTAWSYSGGSFRNAYVLFGGRAIQATGTTVGDGSYYVKVVVSGDTATASVVSEYNKPENGWCVWVGDVSGGVLTTGIKATPAFLVYE